MTNGQKFRVVDFKTSIASDGSEVAYTFRRADGTKAIISVVFNDLAEFILALEAQAGGAIDMVNASLRGADRRLMLPVKKRTVTKLQGAVSRDGQPILSVELDGRLALDMALSSYQVQDLIEWLEQLRSLADKAPPKAN